ncbi:MAG: hypothetical protein RI985_977 [Chloroflexota bacterium]|jgi:purine nucleoside phosphorylase
MTQATIGVIGGSGLYSMPGLSDIETVHLTTPYGAPSDAFVVGTIAGQRVAFCRATASVTGIPRARSQCAPTCMAFACSECAR